MYRSTTPTQSTPAEVDLERKLHKLTTQPDEAGEFRIDPAEKQQVVDAVWGVQDEDSPHYNSVGWVRTAVLLMKTQIGLGVLSIPCKPPRTPLCTNSSLGLTSHSLPQPSSRPSE